MPFSIPNGFSIFTSKEKLITFSCNGENLACGIESRNSAPKCSVFDQAFGPFFFNAASLEINCPLLKCTVQKIIVTSMDRKKSFPFSVFYPWIR